MDNLAHKMVDTFEKMDAINPTFEQMLMIMLIKNLGRLLN